VQAVSGRLGKEASAPRCYFSASTLAHTTSRQNRSAEGQKVRQKVA
jgi:hypothetical protein